MSAVKKILPLWHPETPFIPPLAISYTTSAPPPFISSPISSTLPAHYTQIAPAPATPFYSKVAKKAHGFNREMN